MLLQRSFWFGHKPGRRGISLSLLSHAQPGLFGAQVQFGGSHVLTLAIQLLNGEHVFYVTMVREPLPVAPAAMKAPPSPPAPPAAS